MKAVSKILTAGVGIAALAGAAPAAAQYYPGYGYGGGDILGQIINSVLGAQRYGQQGYGYGYNPQQQRYLVEQCANATQYRIQRRYGSNASYGYGAYGYNNVSPARIVSITSVQPRSYGSVRIYGTATSGREVYGGAYGGGYGGYGGYNPYGGGYNAAAAGDLRFSCTINPRGRITNISVQPNRTGYRGY